MPNLDKVVQIMVKTEDILQIFCLKCERLKTLVTYVTFLNQPKEQQKS